MFKDTLAALPVRSQLLSLYNTAVSPSSHTLVYEGLQSRVSCEKFSMTILRNSAGALLLFLSFVVAFSSAYQGVDLSQPCPSSGFSCMKSSGISFAIVRVFCSTGKVDQNGPATISAAWAGGMSHVDGYIFPCFSCGNPAGQMDQAINNLRSAGLKHIARSPGQNDTVAIKPEELGTSYGMLWLDIEGTQYWGSDQQANTAFIQAMADEGHKQGVTLGVYTSASQWGPITGNAKVLGELPLWYPHYESPPNPSYSDFKPFGAWSKPAIKQFQGSHTLCSCGVDSNVY